jgi:serine/threonine protein kinase
MDKYKILDSIGKGAFGKVRHGIDIQTNREVALKIIKINNQDRMSIQKVKNELKLSKILKHENIVQYYEAFQNDKMIIIIYEFCDGGSLEKYIKEFNNFDNHSTREKKVKNILIQLKNAMEFINKNNIVHRDIKPENILFKLENGIPILKLIDFGLSRSIDSNFVDESGNISLDVSICGTPIYMAPEILFNQGYNIKADLWSFGIIMYQLLYNKTPFNDINNMGDLRNKLIHNEILFNDVYSTECLDLIKLLLINDPNKRIDWYDFISHPWFTGKNIENKNNIDVATESTAIFVIGRDGGQIIKMRDDEEDNDMIIIDLC